MKRQIAIASLVFAGFVPSLAEAGTIVGIIKAVAPKDDASGQSGAYQSRKYKFLDKIDYESLRDFVVSIDAVEKPATGDTARPTASVAQKDGGFDPHIVPVVAGTEVAWPNRDEIYHNVFSMSEVKPFDLGMYKSTEDAKRLVFEKPGQIDVFCAIHSEMHCIVLVLPNPWFSKSDRRGRYEIRDVPPGKYRLKAWHERLPVKYIDIEVPETGELNLDIEMGLGNLPKF